MRRLEQPVALTTILHVLGEFFKIQRITRGDKQRTVSRAVGVTQGVISQIEQGTYHGLTVSLTMRMLAYYGLGPGDLAREVMEKLEVPAGAFNEPGFANFSAATGR